MRQPGKGSNDALETNTRTIRFVSSPYVRLVRSRATSYPASDLRGGDGSMRVGPFVTAIHLLRPWVAAGGRPGARVDNQFEELLCVHV